MIGGWSTPVVGRKRDKSIRNICLRNDNRVLLPTGTTKGGVGGFELNLDTESTFIPTDLSLPILTKNLFTEEVSGQPFSLSIT